VPESCDWSASETRLDLKSGSMYFVTPAASPGDVPEPGEEESDGTEYVVWVVGLGEAKPAKKLEIPLSKQVPTILLMSNGRQLLVSYQNLDSKLPTVDTFDTTTLKKINTVKQTTGDILSAYFPIDTYFVVSGKLIVRGDNRIGLASGQFKAEYVDPRAKLSREDLKKLSGFVKTEKDGQKVIPVGVAASVNGKTLELVSNPELTATAFWTMDMETGTTSPAVVTNYYAKGEMIGAGEEFAAFEAHYVPPTSEAAFQILKTGRIAIYSVKSGALAREFNIPEIKGEGDLLCSSGDGSLAAYAHGKELVILDLKTGRVTRVAGSFEELPQPKYLGACAFGE
jgi:hypothetical protein